MDTKIFPCIYYRNPFLSENGIYWFYALFSDNCSYHTFLCLSQDNKLCSHNGTGRDSLGLQERFTHQAPHHTEHHILTMPSLPSIEGEHDGRVKSIMSAIIISIIMVTTIDILICIFQKMEIYLITGWIMFSTVARFKMVIWKT